jgi:hypothetical protein
MNRPAEDRLSTIEQLNKVAMSSLERRNALEDLRTAESFVDFLFAAASQVSGVAAITSRRAVVLVRRLSRYGKKQRRMAHI